MSTSEKIINQLLKQLEEKNQQIEKLKHASNRCKFCGSDLDSCGH
jgi:flagellar hook-associated protein FlgK